MDNDNSRKHYTMLLFECCTCFAVALLTSWSSIRFIPDISMPVLLLAHSCTVFAAIFTFIWLGRKNDVDRFLCMGVCLVLACMPPAALAASIAGVHVTPAPVLLVSILLGAGMGAGMMLVATLLGSCILKNSDAMFSSCMFIALLASLLLCWAPPAVTAASSILFSAVTYLLYRFAASTMPETLRIQEGTNLSVVKARTSVALSCQTACAAVIIAVSAASDPLSLPLALAGSLAGVAVGGIAQHFSEGDHMSPASMQRATGAILASTVVIAGCVALAANPHAALLAAAPCAGCGLAMLLVFNWNVLVTEVREFSLAPFPHFKKGFVGIWTGVAVGLAVVAAGNMAASSSPGDATIIYTLMTGCAALCLVISPVFCKPDDSEDFDSIYQLFTIEEEPVFEGRPQALEKQCAIVAEQHSLTKREGEVLEYLARGRNAKHIQDELCVSFSTAKTHIYHIYQKLGINSQQQLIDLVENAKDE